MPQTDLRYNLDCVRYQNFRRHMVLTPPRQALLRPDQEMCFRYGVGIFSAEQIVDFSPAAYHLSQVYLLRIHGKKEDILYPLPFASEYQKIFTVMFDDVQRFEHDSPDLAYLTFEQAEALVDFLYSIPPTAFFAVHCFAGISRSSAVALVYAKMRSLPELEDIILHCGLYSPNVLVVNVLLAVLRHKGMRAA